MINPETGRAALSIALFMILASGGMLLFQTPGTAEFVVTTVTLVLGLLFLALIVVLVKRSSR